MTKCRIDRTNCTSCGTCWDSCPEYFAQDANDSLSSIAEEYRIDADPGLGTVPEDLLECVNEAVDLCPVQVISLED